MKHLIGLLLLFCLSTVKSDLDFCDYYLPHERCRWCRMPAMQTWRHALCLCGCLLAAHSLNSNPCHFHSTLLYTQSITQGLLNWNAGLEISAVHWQSGQSAQLSRCANCMIVNGGLVIQLAKSCCCC